MIGGGNSSPNDRLSQYLVMGEDSWLVHYDRPGPLGERERNDVVAVTSVSTIDLGHGLRLT